MKMITFKISSNDLGQLLDGLDVLIEQWEATAEYLETGIAREDVCIRESHSVHEAESIGAIYRDLRERLREQALIA